jgi:phosphoenolpyruvate synthase/pyruvate phosphate dikinase
MPEAFAEFTASATVLEAHYRDMQDMEFTIENGTLWMLQTRSRQAHRQGGDEDRRRYGREG